MMVMVSGMLFPYVTRMIERGLLPTGETSCGRVNRSQRG